MVESISPNPILGDYLSERELAALLERSERTLARWRRARTGPSFTQIGRKILYRAEAVREWLASREVSHARERAGPRRLRRAC